MTHVQVQHIYSASQGAITSTDISDNVYRNGPVATGGQIDLGSGTPMYGVVTVDVTGTGAGTLEVQFVSATNAALSSSVRVHHTLGAIVGTSLVAGTTYQFALPPKGGQGGAYQEYVGFKYVVTSTVGAVKLTAAVVPFAPDVDQGYPVSGLNFA